MHSCLICIGSNYNRKENLLLARLRLATLFPSIRFANEQVTKPLFFHNSRLFSNQMARFMTDADAPQVIDQLKIIEREAGRQPDDKKKEKVCLDIDLLAFDECILKPDDLKRDYVMEGLQDLEKLFDYKKI